MASRDTFGPGLKRLRIRRGIALAQIAATTKVGEDLWAAMERNDFSRWPAGIYARAYLRAYATLIDVDPESVVDEFCRWFPQGDRRAERVLREHASIVGHALEWRDDVAADEAELGRRRDDALRAADARPRGEWRRPIVRAWHWMARLVDAAGRPRGDYASRGRDARPAGDDGAPRRPAHPHAAR